MSWKSAPKNGRSQSGGRPGEAARKSQSHRWQVPKAGAGRARPRRYINRSLTIIGLAIALVAFLIFLVVKRPHPTPLVALAVTSYSAPAPVNGWAQEDVERLSALANLKVSNISVNWGSDKNAHCSILPGEVKLDRLRSNVPVIFYVNAHGVVNDSGEPCLLPPGTSVSDAKEWKLVSQVFDEILNDQRVGEDRNVLVILDSTRIQADWRLGILYNSFVERVQQLVGNNEKYANNPHFAVMVSSAPAQKSWASAELAGSVFGRYLQLGLAGKADENPGLWHSHVSLRELATYLKENVNKWAEFNRGEFQEPILLAAEGVDFPLTSVSLAAVPDSFANEDEPNDAISGEDLAPLWDSLQLLRDKHELVRLDPGACSSLEHRLLRLEQMTMAGEAYAKSAEDSFNDLQAELDELKQRATNAVKSYALADHLEVFGEAAWAKQASAAHSLPAGEYFGAISRQRAEQIEGYLRDIAGTDTSQSPSPVPGSGGIEESAGQLVEAQIIASAIAQKAGELWPRHPHVIAEIATLRATAEQLSVPRDANGHPGDERAQYFVRQFTSTADCTCREMEDMLFVGELNTADKDIEQLDPETMSSIYGRPKNVMETSSQNFHVSDLAAAETPYLAEWLCNPLASSDEVSDAENTRDLRELIVGQRTLGNQLRQIDASLPATGELPFEARGRQVQTAYEGVRNRFDKECAHVVDSSSESVTELRAIDSLLLAPLIAGDKRKELLERRAAISMRRHKEFSESIPQSSHSQTTDTYLERISRWKSHPVLELCQVSLPEEKSESWQPFELVAPKLRKVLSSTESFDHSGADHRLGETVAQQRDMLSRDELSFRIGAALAYDSADASDTSKSAERDPIEQLRRFDVQQLLLGLCERAADDFWGAAKDNDDDFSFNKVADDYLKAAYVVGPVGHALPTEVSGAKRLNALLKSRSEAKKDGLEVGAKSELRIAEGATAEITIAVRSSPEAVPTDFPAGRVAIFLRDGTNRMPVRVEALGNSRLNYFLSPPKSSDSVKFKVNAAIKPDVNYLNANIFFRGQAVAREFSVRSLAGIRVAYEPHRYQEQSITLSGDLKQRSSLVFVLDCSGSMSVEDDNEREAGPARVAINRLDRAKTALVAMLKELARLNYDGADIKVGVWLFGHRVNWSKDNPNVIARQQDYEGDIPSKTSPQEDFEQIYELGAFEDSDAKDVEELLESVKPHGMTPLYGTLIAALKKNFPDPKRDTRAALIVITDGADDDDYRPSDSPLDIPPALEYQDVLQKWKEHRVPVHILGFNLRPFDDGGITQADVDAAKREYQEIAQKTGGTYADANDGGQLLQLLREQLSIDYYSVKNETHPAGELLTSDREPPRLNDIVSVQALQSPVEKFLVGFRSSSKEVALEGGEAIVLHVSDDGKNIEAVPYDRGVATQVRPSAPAVKRLIAGSDGSESNILFRVHHPVWEGPVGSDVIFKFSLQRDPKTGEHFTERPKDTWVEVTPVDGNGKQMPSYVFYDRQIKPDEPVPVLEWTALDWPKSAHTARIRFWCNLKVVRETPFQLSQVQLGRFMPVPGEPNAKFKIEQRSTQDGEEIYVEERHSPSSPAGIDAIRVRLANDPFAQLNHVEHRFDKKEGVVTHTFRFAGLSDADVLQSATIAIALERDIKKAAFQLPENEDLEVRIGGRDIAFPIEAAGSP